MISPVAYQPPVSYQITVSTAIGEPKLTLFGWTSPKALVELSGQRVADEVIADEKGYFFFDRIFLPRPNPNYPELCLSAIDTQSRVSFPTCLAPLPGGPFNITVGPVLLPPTLSLSGPSGAEAGTGATIPKVAVEISFANELPASRQGGASVGLVRQANAFFLPKYQLTSDENGNFEFNLPNHPATAGDWRLFASAYFQNFATPKSNTLTFRVLSPWALFWQQITKLWGFILALVNPYLWILILVAEIAILVGLFTKTQRRKQPSLPSVRQVSLKLKD